MHRLLVLPRRTCTSPRLARRRWLMVAALAATTACGDVHFIPSPYSPQRVELIYSQQEQVTIVRWQMETDVPGPETRFELLDVDGSYKPIDFSKSVFPGGVQPCSSATTEEDGLDTTIRSCGQYVVRGRYSVAKDAHPLRANRDPYGILPGSVATATEVATTLSLRAYFGPRNEFVYLQIEDAVANGAMTSFPRTFARGIWPSTGLCLMDMVPEDVRFVDLEPVEGFPAPTPLTDLGSYCIAARTKPSDGGPTTAAQSRALTVPVFVNGSFSYRPKTETAPLIYRIVFDLALPPAPRGEPDNCAAAMQTIERVVDEHMNEIRAPKVKQPTLDLGGGTCKQAEGRALNVSDMGIELQTVLASRPEVHHGPFLLYFNNVNAPLPSTLTDSFLFLQQSVIFNPEKSAQPQNWLFGTPKAYSGSGNFTWSFWSAWMSTDDTKAISDQIEQVAREQLPFMSELHDATKPIALLTAEQVATYEGARIKICSASPTVLPATMSGLFFTGYSSWPILAADPPGVTVGFPPEIMVPSTTFTNHLLNVRYQICTKYCSDHPYVDTSNKGQSSWAIDPACAGEGT